MFKLIAVTNRNLCRDNFLERIEAIVQTDVSALILREKELRQEEYELLAREVLSICEQYNTECMFHFFADSLFIKTHGCIHIPLWILKENKDIRRNYSKIGVSIHSLKEATEALALGADYLVAGHIFETNCKKGLKPRGIDFLREVCENVDIPVYAIGGITEKNIRQIKDAGASGGCIMSEFMKRNDLNDFGKKIRNELNLSEK